MELLLHKNYPFVAMRKKAYLFSGALVGLSLLLFLIMGLNYGVDFVGGTSMEVKFKDAVELDKIRQIVTSKFNSDRIQNFGAPNEVLIHVHEQGEKVSGELVSLLQTSFQGNDVEIRSVSQVGPKVGDELKSSAVWATIWLILTITNSAGRSGANPTSRFTTPAP